MGFSSAGDKMAGDLVQGKKKRKEKTTKTKTKKTQQLCTAAPLPTSLCYWNNDSMNNKWVSLACFWCLTNTFPSISLELLKNLHNLDSCYCVVICQANFWQMSVPCNKKIKCYSLWKVDEYFKFFFPFSHLWMVVLVGLYWSKRALSVDKEHSSQTL